LKVTADTNVLLRLFVDDDPAQGRAAAEMLAEAETVAISLHALCELAWVLDSSYNATRTDIAAAIRRLLDMGNVVANRAAVETGLAVLKAGGDFADGIIAYEGDWLGGDTFVSFDRKAVRLLATQGRSAHLLS
jgi:predicted nucleic-acid-binding protein